MDAESLNTKIGLKPTLPLPKLGHFDIKSLNGIPEYVPQITNNIAQNAIKGHKTIQKVVKPSFKTLASFINWNLEPLVKNNLEFHKICLQIQTDWPKMSYSSNKNSKNDHLIYVMMETPKPPI